MADTEDSREKRLAYLRAWYAANREKTLAQHKAWRAANPEKTKEASRRNHAQQRENQQRYAFVNHKDSAKRRKIEFLLTFDEWWEIWRESGKFEQRGRCKGEYCMARQEDTGPYAVGNVRVCLNEENKREAHRLRRGKPMSANRLAGLVKARAAVGPMSDEHRAALVRAHKARWAKIPAAERQAQTAKMRKARYGK